MTNEEKLLNLLGLAQRAGRLASGGEAAEGCIRSGKAALVLLASDASEGTRKRYEDMARFRKVELCTVLTKEKLGASIGKAERSAVAVADAGFAKAMKKCLV